MRRYIRIIGVVFICSTLTLAYFGYLLLDRFNQAVKYTDEVNRTYELINKMEQLESFAKDAETAQRGYFITQDSAYLAPLFDIQHKIYPLADNLVHLVQDKKQKERLILLKLSVAALMNYINFNLESPKASIKTFLKKDMDDGKHLMDRLRAEVVKIKDIELKFLADRNNTKANYLKSTSATFITVLIIVAIIMIATFSLLIRELRKRYRFQLQLQNQIVQLQQFTKESEELSYAVSHDLQEPLRKMRIFTDRLFQKHKDELDNEGKQIVQRINVVAATAQDTMNELLRFTSVIPQIGDKASVDLNELTTMVWEKMAANVTAKNASIIIENLPIIKGSEIRLAVLFENLLCNALVFSKEDVPLVIKISAYKTTGNTIKQAATYQRKMNFNAIEISDNGIGFADEYAVKIFQLFRRLHVGQAKYPGKGIGLAICHRIMSNHHGYITAKGKVGEGAVFTVYFPVMEE